MITTIKINEVRICSYKIKDNTLFIHMYGMYDNELQKEKYVRIIKELISDTRKSFDFVKYLPIIEK